MTTTASRKLVWLVFAVLAAAVVVKATSFGSILLTVATLVVGMLFLGGVISVWQVFDPPDSRRRQVDR
jgi:hypothetical protein